MDTRIRSVVAALAVFLSAGSVEAHHSIGVIFNRNVRVTLTGTLTKVSWINPHIELFLDVKSARGPVEDWVIEGRPPHTLPGRGFNKSDLEKAVGQTVTLEVSRARDGTLYGYLERLNGKPVG